MRFDCVLTARAPLPRSRSFLCGRVVGDLGSVVEVPWLVVLALAETVKVGKADVCWKSR